jgi:glycerol-3-phosphate acyltransferase PlsY
VKPVLLLLGAYLLGSIPFSFLVARAFGVEDVRKVGSGNVGATNVMRAAGRLAGILAFVGDAAKGGIATSLVRALAGGDTLPAWAATCAILGHMYPVWLGFKGGKGVSTGVGAFIPLAPLPSLLALVVFALALPLTRYAALASLFGTFTLAGAAIFLSPRPVAASALLSAALILWRHRGNLERLRARTERRLWEKA